MKSCEYYEELISRSLDDALNVEERKELAVHLASCPSCSQMRQLMADISQMMEEDTEELPAGLHENIMAGIRRSEMIKANKTAGTPGKHFVPRKITITRPVRNLLATAACMALVIAAAVSVNPAGRAEGVIAARSMPEVTATQEPQAAAAAPVTVEPSATPVPAPASTVVPDEKAAAADRIVTTPAPTPDLYLSTPTPRPTQTPVQNVTGTIIDKVPPTPAPTPVPTPEPVATEAPVPTEIPQPTEAPAAYNEDRMTEVESSVQEANNSASAAAVPQEEMPVELQKVPPVRVFSLIPSLAELLPEQSPAEDSGSPGALLQAAPPTATPVPTPAPSDAPQPVVLNLVDNEKAGDLVLLLAGTLDEDGQPPEEAELPEGDWDESFVVEMVFDQIPCELTVRIYGQEVYFSLAEILIDPAAVDGAVQPPVSTPAVTPAPVESMEPVSGSGETEEAPEEDFEPQWLLAKCGSEVFTALLNETVK